jgi:hypothetical protein
LFPALPRYGHGDLFSECGQRETFEGDFIAAHIVQAVASSVLHIHNNHLRVAQFPDLVSRPDKPDIIKPATWA